MDALYIAIVIILGYVVFITRDNKNLKLDKQIYELTS